jgi:hypothetical protein
MRINRICLSNTKESRGIEQVIVKLSLTFLGFAPAKVAIFYRILKKKGAHLKRPLFPLDTAKAA